MAIQELAAKHVWNVVLAFCGRPPRVIGEETEST